MRNRSRIILLMVVAVLVIVGLRFFSSRFGNNQVSKTQVTKTDLEISTSVSGKVKAVREVSLSFPISGKLSQVATEGAQVAEGEVVALLDTFDLYSAYQSSLASLNKARSAYSNAIEAKAEIDATYAGREGDNIVKASKKLSWFKGHTVLSTLDSFEKAKAPEEKDFKLPVQDVYKFTEYNDDRRIIAGRVESGSISVGDKVVFLPSNKQSEIKSIEGFNVNPRKSISSGHSAGFTLKEQIFVNRGQIMCKVNEKLPYLGSEFKANIFWMGKKPMASDKEYKLKLATSDVPVRLHRIVKVLDSTDLAASCKQQIERHDVAECIIHCKKEIAFDLASEIEATGRFVIVDNYDIAGGGIVTETIKSDEAGIIREDLRGEVCPITLNHSKEFIDRLKKGDVLEILIDHLPAIETIGNFAFKHNLQFSFEKLDKKDIKIVIRK